MEVKGLLMFYIFQYFRRYKWTSWKSEVSKRISNISLMNLRLFSALKNWEKKKLKATAILLSTTSHQQEVPSIENTVLWRSRLLGGSDAKPIKYESHSNALSASIIFRLLENDHQKQQTVGEVPSYSVVQFLCLLLVLSQ